MRIAGCPQDGLARSLAVSRISTAPQLSRKSVGHAIELSPCGVAERVLLLCLYLPLACVGADFDAFQKDLQNIWGSEHRRLHAFLAEEDITFAARWGLK
jgi:hypothetical protein